MLPDATDALSLKLGHSHVQLGVNMAANMLPDGSKVRWCVGGTGAASKLMCVRSSRTQVLC